MSPYLVSSPITNESPRARDGDGDGIKENDDNGDDCCDHSSVHRLSPYQAFCPRPQTAN